MDDLREMEQEARLLYEKRELFWGGFAQGMLTMAVIFWAGCCLVALILRLGA